MTYRAKCEGRRARRAWVLERRRQKTAADTVVTLLRLPRYMRVPLACHMFTLTAADFTTLASAP